MTSIKELIVGIDPKKLLRNKKVIEEINRHKWLESEIAGYDVGFEAAAEDWLKNYASAWLRYHMSNGNISAKSISASKKKKS